MGTVCAPAACGLPAERDAGSPFAVEVVSFMPGPGAGFGQDRLPDVVLGPPVPAGSRAQASLDVVSLGRGGSIVLRFGRPAVNGPGPDLLVFENPFLVGGGPRVFGEPGEVAVSEDGEAFVSFPCAPEADPPNGCAGWGIVDGGIGAGGIGAGGIGAGGIGAGQPSTLAEDAPLDPRVSGGDAFDLEELGVSVARFVRITDRGTNEASPTAGFDLDAVAVAAAGIGP